jgi:hypothetical protein
MSGELIDSTVATTIKSQFVTKSVNWTDATFANNGDGARRITIAMSNDVRISGQPLLVPLVLIHWV